jgi:uncharacterized protein YneF (UPF0154 family)
MIEFVILIITAAISFFFGAIYGINMLAKKIEKDLKK